MCARESWRSESGSDRLWWGGRNVAFVWASHQNCDLLPLPLASRTTSRDCRGARRLCQGPSWRQFIFPQSPTFSPVTKYS